MDVCDCPLIVTGLGQPGHQSGRSILRKRLGLRVGALASARSYCCGNVGSFEEQHSFVLRRAILCAFSLQSDEPIARAELCEMSGCVLRNIKSERVEEELFRPRKDGGREGIRTPGLLIANSGENNLRQGGGDYNRRAPFVRVATGAARWMTIPTA